MGNISADTINTRIKNLPSEARREVYDFIEFLMTKRLPKKKLKASKERLLSVSVWTKKDLSIFEEIGKDINKWNIARF